MHGGPMLQAEKLLALAKRQFNRREYHLAEDLVQLLHGMNERLDLFEKASKRSSSVVQVKDTDEN